MPISDSSALERIARVLCAQRLSSNAEGSNPSAGEAVELAWREHIDGATAVLKTLREPDAQMAAVGSVELWERMVRAALGEEESIGGRGRSPAGTDPLHTGP